MRRVILPVAIAALALATSPALAGYGTPVVDGTRDALYGAPLSVQTLRTSFGNSTNGNLLGGGGSELNALYIANDGNSVFILLTGNLESNGNTLYILIDDTSDATGPNVLPNIPGKDNLFNTGKLGGATMPAGFGPELGFVIKGFSNPLVGGNSDWDYVYSIADFVAGTSQNPPNDVTTLATTNPAIGNDSSTSIPISFGLNNSNIAGVGGAAPAAFAVVDETPADVATGFEIAFPISAVASPSATIKVMAFVSSGDGAFASNQFMPPLATPQDHVGNPPGGGYNFETLGIVPASYTLVTPLAAGSWALYE